MASIGCLRQTTEGDSEKKRRRLYCLGVMEPRNSGVTVFMLGQLSKSRLFLTSYILLAA